jgi:homoserine kinase type II
MDFEKLHMWGLEPAKLRQEIALPGSPERCVKRLAVEDAKGDVWVLERLFPKQRARRERIGALLAHLADAGLDVAPYQALPGGRFVAEADGYHWQVSPYAAGDILPQPDYVDHAERGVALGGFLADLHEVVLGYPAFAPEPALTLKEYTAELLRVMHTREPELRAALKPLKLELAPLFEAWAELPHGLKHGDFHPLNVVWRGRGVVAVLDWEFAGNRPKLYDLANCLGCVGIEDPSALSHGLAPAMLATLRDRGMLDCRDVKLLPYMILGLRFAWMSEWLRRKDAEMQALELRYMRLLANSMDELQRLFHGVFD